MRINREIRAPRVRVIDKDGQQLGVLTVVDAISRAEMVGLDLVEIAPSADPPVCKIIDFGKYRYQQTKKEKESKKSQHQVRVKEIKVKPKSANIAGLQVSDLLAHPCKQEVLFEEGRVVEGEQRFGVEICKQLKNKYNRHAYSGRVQGYGKVFLK